MYVCGITPYDATHLGHAATYLDVRSGQPGLARRRTRVHYVQNITDVDDPLFERADRDGMDWIDLGMRETATVPRGHGGAAGASAARLHRRRRIGERGRRVGRETAGAGAAYIVDDAEYPDVYFRADATEQFGYESGYDRATMEKFFAERGGDPDRPASATRSTHWSGERARPGEPSWPSPFGPGRPGWHIECAAIAFNRIGSGFDVQGGGSDLIFPHHEYSAAHAEAADG